MVRSYFEVSRCGAIKALPDTKAALLYHSYHPSNHLQDSNMKQGSWDDGCVKTDLKQLLLTCMMAFKEILIKDVLKTTLG